MKKDAKEKLYGLGQNLGVTKDEITSTIKMRKQIIYMVIPVIAFSFATTAFFSTLGGRYGGFSIEDFEILKRFKFLRFLFGL